MKSLNRQRIPESFLLNPYDFIVDMSDVAVTKLQAEALSLGLKICVPRRKIDPTDIEAKFEDLQYQLSDLKPTSKESAGWLKADITYQYRKIPVIQRPLLTKQPLTALNDLRKATNIVISRPDKGSGVVTLNKDDYGRKMQAILNEPSKFSSETHGKEETKVLEDLIGKRRLNRYSKNG
ncbi:unnamed protein product [Dibothriocephalus latus]|uniref:Uncharacterized protein n=1 Tax=Dibothriocephalus latus TaxID=60516 RepID=A0A3P7NZX5_DIBLA|nr:unnamed protein product [Dibothriocephalus latus]